MDATTILWCCHVRGPDDVVAAPDYDIALRWADGFNEWMATRLDVSLLDPRSNAVPAPWPWSAEAHAEDLAKSDGEYRWLDSLAGRQQDRSKFFPNDRVGGWTSERGSVIVRRTPETVTVEIARGDSATLRFRPDQAYRLARLLDVAATTEPLAAPGAV